MPVPPPRSSRSAGSTAAQSRPGGTRSEAVAERIRAQIVRGELAAGDRLESLRDYARVCGCAKNTVVDAYERLVEEGLIEPRRGAGYFVIGPRRPSASDAWTPAMARALGGLGVDIGDEDTPQHHPAHSPADGLPPSAWLEPCRLDRYLQKVGRSGLGTVFRTGDPRGYEPLRQHLARRLQAFGIGIDASCIVLTHGAFHAVDLIIRQWVRPGDTVLVDAPGFYPTVNKLKLQGARIVGIERTVDGPDIRQLARAASRGRARLFFTQSVAHNPTGTDVSAGVAQEVIRIARTHGLLLIDDDALADFKPATALRLSALDQLEHSLYVGSFAKTISSLLRVGFVAGNMERSRLLLNLKSVTSLNSSQYVERAVDAIITEGRFQRHVFQLQKRARAATRQAAQALHALGAEILHVPKETLYLWARFPAVPDSVALAQQLARRGVILAPGTMFYPDARSSPWFRVNVAFMDDRRIIDTLREVLQAQKRSDAV